MKRFLLAGIFLLTQLAAQAVDSAYSALRVVGHRDGQDSLNRVVEVRGRGGAPQPPVWKIVFDDPRSRGGLREIEVQRGQILSERTPVGRATGGRMNFTRLNLDSEGAFTIANQEAQKAGVPFDRVDYFLHNGASNNAPVWALELFDSRLGHTASFQISAESGAVIARNFDRRPAPIAQEDRAYVDDRRRPDERPPEDLPSAGVLDDGHSRPGEPFRDVPDFFHRLGKRFQKRGVQIENFFTGRHEDPDAPR